jgi:hypothetical protein
MNIRFKNKLLQLVEDCSVNGKLVFNRTVTLRDSWDKDLLQRSTGIFKSLA